MKRTVTSLLLCACGLMALTPALGARERHGGAGRPGAPAKEAPGPNHRPGGPNHRPGQQPGGPGNHRPGGPNHRPGQQPGGPGSHRPGGPNHRPGQMRPQPGGPRPGQWGHVPPSPMPWHRPPRPAGWRPAPGVPSIGAVLGLALGSAFHTGLDALLGSVYNVVGYGNGVIALSSVPYFDYVWPEARMIYSNGVLSGSQFVYVSPRHDLGRYRSLYSRLTARYGYPASSVPLSGGMQTTWYGAGGGFVTLVFRPVAGPGGVPSYYTILNLGI